MNEPRLHGRALQALRHRGWAVLCLLLCLGGAGVLAASPASAASAVLGICDPDAPIPDAPGTGMPGFFMDPGTLRPPRLTGDKADTTALFNDSGFSGLGSSTYDLGCSTNPDNWGKTLSAMGDTSFGNKAVAVGQSATALADAADTRAWDPSWVLTVVGDFMHRVMDVVVLRVLAPFLAAGLLAASVFLIYQSRKGDVAAVAGGVAWALFVVVIASLLVTGPLRIATTTQNVGADTISVLNADQNSKPGRAATEQVMYAVHYQGWLRRTFGSANSETAKQYGPQLLAASRLTRAEFNATDPGRTVDGKPLSTPEREAALNARKALLRDKAKAYEKIAAEIKDADPSAYRYLQGTGGTTTGVGFVEMSFALIAAGFRLAADLLLILCIVILAALAVVWVVGAPFLVTAWGESLGRGLMNNTARAVVFVGLAALGSWLFGIWTQVALGPGIAAWWSMLLLIVGTLIFWSLLRPDRKALNLITMGHLHGHSKTLRRLAMAAGGAYALGKIGSAATALKNRVGSERDALRSEFRRDPEGAETARTWRLGHAKGPDPYSLPDTPEVDPYRLTGTTRVGAAPDRPVPASMPVFIPERYDQPTAASVPEPPPSGAFGDEKVYQTDKTTTTEWWKR